MITRRTKWLRPAASTRLPSRSGGELSPMTAAALARSRGEPRRGTAAPCPNRAIPERMVTASRGGAVPQPGNTRDLHRRPQPLACRGTGDGDDTQANRAAATRSIDVPAVTQRRRTIAMTTGAPTRAGGEPRRGTAAPCPNRAIPADTGENE